MHFDRRQFVVSCIGASSLSKIESAAAQSYPGRPVRILVPVAPGGTPDLTSRIVANWLSDRFGKQFFVENRAGASGNIAMEALVRAPPDGHTLLLAGPGYAASGAMYDKLGFDFLRDTRPIASLVSVPLVIVVNRDLPIRSVPEMLAWSTRNELNMGSAGVGSPNHMAGELFRMMTKIEMAHVPYRGSAPALIDLLSGNVQVIFSTIPAAIAHIRTDRIRAIAVTTAMRAAILPDVPSVSEAVPGYEMNSWAGFVAHANTPSGIVESLHAEIASGLASEKVRAQFNDLGADPFPGSAGAFGAFLATETEKWTKVVRFSGLKAE